MQLELNSFGNRIYFFMAKTYTRYPVLITRSTLEWLNLVNHWSVMSVTIDDKTGSVISHRNYTGSKNNITSNQCLESSENPQFLSYQLTIKIL